MFGRKRRQKEKLLKLQSELSRVVDAWAEAEATADPVARYEALAAVEARANDLAIPTAIPLSSKIASGGFLGGMGLMLGVAVTGPVSIVVALAGGIGGLGSVFVLMRNAERQPESPAIYTGYLETRQELIDTVANGRKQLLEAALPHMAQQDNFKALADNFPEVKNAFADAALKNMITLKPATKELPPSDSFKP